MKVYKWAQKVLALDWSYINKLSDKVKLKTVKTWELKKFFLAILSILVVWRSAKAFSISSTVKIASE